MKIEKMQSLLEKGLDMNHYMLIHFLLSGENVSSLLENLKVQGWLATLERKGYLVKATSLWEVTEEGKKLYDDKVVVQKVLITMDYDSIHKSLQNKLFSFKKKKQITGFGGVYFIPTVRELEEFLLRFRRKYPELWDLKKIEKALLFHVERCCKKDSFAPAVKYFIIKEGSGSPLAAALEIMEDGEEIDESKQQYNIVNTKDMFK